MPWNRSVRHADLDRFRDLIRWCSINTCYCAHVIIADKCGYYLCHPTTIHWARGWYVANLLLFRMLINKTYSNSHEDNTGLARQGRSRHRVESRWPHNNIIMIMTLWWWRVKRCLVFELMNGLLWFDVMWLRDYSMFTLLCGIYPTVLFFFVLYTCPSYSLSASKSFERLIVIYSSINW